MTLKARCGALLVGAWLAFAPPGFAADRSHPVRPAGSLGLAELWQRLCDAMPVLHRLGKLVPATAQSDGRGTMDPDGRSSQDGGGTMDPDG